MERTIHILLIDRNDHSARAITSLLASDNIFTFVVERVKSFESALQKIKKSHVDVMLLNIEFWHNNDVVSDSESMISYEKFYRQVLKIPLLVMSDLDVEVQDDDIIKLGVQDYFVVEHVTRSRMRRIILRAIERHNVRIKLHTVNEKLEVKSKELENFYHVLSHELKTPLTSIVAFTQILLDGLTGDLNHDQQEYLEIIKSNSARLNLYIDDLLDVSRLESGKISLNKDNYCIEEVMTDVVKTMQHKAETKAIALSVKTGKKLPKIYVDKERIVQVLINFVNNAIKFTQEGGEVCITAKAQGKKHVQISVKDNGCGIPDKNLPKVFDKLYQVGGEAADQHKGLGLGLFIAKQLIDLHQGEVTVKSSEGKGAEFVLVLPIDTQRAGRAFSTTLSVEKR